MINRKGKRIHLNPLKQGFHFDSLRYLSIRISLFVGLNPLKQGFHFDEDLTDWIDVIVKLS